MKLLKSWKLKMKKKKININNNFKEYNCQKKNESIKRRKKITFSFVKNYLKLVNGKKCHHEIGFAFIYFF